MSTHGGASLFARFRGQFGLARARSRAGSPIEAGYPIVPDGMGIEPSCGFDAPTFAAYLSNKAPYPNFQ